MIVVVGFLGSFGCDDRMADFDAVGSSGNALMAVAVADVAVDGVGDDGGCQTNA